MILLKFKTAREEICNYLQLSMSKVLLTMDMWTSITTLGILAIIIHYINNSWQFKHFVLDVLSFHHHMIHQQSKIQFYK